MNPNSESSSLSGLSMKQITLAAKYVLGTTLYNVFRIVRPCLAYYLKKIVNLELLSTAKYMITLANNESFFTIYKSDLVEWGRLKCIRGSRLLSTFFPTLFFR